MVGLQQHNDFLKTAAETIRAIDAVGSDWFGCILDIGSLRSGDPYAEIEKLVPYAVSWQIKENVGRDGKEEPTDLAKIKAIIDRSGYRGYFPLRPWAPAILGEDHRLPRYDPPDLRSVVSPPPKSWPPAYFSAGPCNCWGQKGATPSVTTTGFEVMCISAEFKPSRLAVTVIVPAVRVERTATRLMPHSVLR